MFPYWCKSSICAAFEHLKQLCSLTGMSFNAAEIQKAVSLIPLKDSVIEYVEIGVFSGLPDAVPDLNLVFRFEKCSHCLVFGLKAPAVGVYYVDNTLMRTSKQTFRGAFYNTKDVEQFPGLFAGAKVEQFSQVDGDRVVELRVKNKLDKTYILKVELFSAKPNWIIFEETLSNPIMQWRNTVFGASKTQGVFSIRDFNSNSDFLAASYQYFFSLKLENYYASILQSVQTKVQANLARASKLRNNLKKQLQDLDDSAELLTKVELLKSQIYRFEKNRKQSSVDLESYDAQGNLTLVPLVLNPQITISENLTKLYQRIKKNARAKVEVDARLQALNDEIPVFTRAVAALRDQKSWLTSDKPTQWLRSVYDRLKELGLNPTLYLDSPTTNTNARDSNRLVQYLEKKQKRAERRGIEPTKFSIKQFRSSDQFAVWVGKTHQDNEELVIRMARGNDVWMHIKGRPGAHTIVQVPNGKSVPLRTLLEAAQLTAYYSGSKDGEKVDVDYTYRKYVKRVAGGKSQSSTFLVTYSQNKTLTVKVDEKELLPILRTSQTA